MAISTNLTQRLGIEHPVLLAPMGFVAGGALAAAVSAAGGLGMLGGGYADPDWLEREFAAAGHRPIGCGFITWALAERPASLDVALKYQPAAIMLSFGDAAPFLPQIKRAGALAMCQVQSLAQARQCSGTARTSFKAKPAGMAAGVRPYRSCRRSSIWWRVQAAACPWWRRRHHRWTQAGGDAHARCGWRGDGHARLRGVESLPHRSKGAGSRDERRQMLHATVFDIAGAIRGRRSMQGGPSESLRRGVAWRGGWRGQSRTHPLC
jgi:hypothetical protein